jgi:transposase InsO family protein
MPMQGGLSVEGMCELARVSRAGFYRSLQEGAPGEEDSRSEVRDSTDCIGASATLRLSSVTAELRRRWMRLNHKRVWRMMREDNLLAVEPGAFVMTTDSNHALEIYLNLAGRMTLTGIDQLWVADITYIRLRAEFVYPAVILDGVSVCDPGRAARCDGGIGAGDCGSAARTGTRARFRPRGAVCVDGIHCDPNAAWDGSEHESASESVR